MKYGHRRLKPYGEREQRGRFILDDYSWSLNHTKAVTIHRWKWNLKKKARANNRANLRKAMNHPS